MKHQLREFFAALMREIEAWQVMRQPTTKGWPDPDVLFEDQGSDSESEVHSV